MESKVDETDWRLLVELQENARTTFSELGRRVGLTAPAVAERVRRLEESGVITGYRVELDTEKLGFPVTAVILLRTLDGNCARFAAVAREMPEVQACHRVTGGDSYVMKVSLSSVQHLESLLDRLGAYGTTTTSLVLSSPVRHRLVRPPAASSEPAPRPAPDGAGAGVVGVNRTPRLASKV